MIRIYSWSIQRVLKFIFGRPQASSELLALLLILCGLPTFVPGTSEDPAEAERMAEDRDTQARNAMGDSAPASFADDELAMNLEVSGNEMTCLFCTSQKMLC